MDDEDYNFEEEYDVFQNEEYEIFDRIPFLERDVLEKLEEGGMVIEKRKKGDIIKDPTYRFYIYVDATARQLVQSGVLSLSQQDIQYVLDTITNLSEAKYKNPTGYVIGYVLTKNGTIDKKMLTSLTPKLKTLEYPIKVEDAIRYANLWLRLRG